MFTALVESSFQHNIGFDINTGNTLIEDVCLFGEAQSRVLISVNPEKETTMVNYLNGQNSPYQKLGKTISNKININQQEWKVVGYWKDLYDDAIEKQLDN